MRHNHPERLPTSHAMPFHSRTANMLGRLSPSAQVLAVGFLALNLMGCASLPLDLLLPPLAEPTDGQRWTAEVVARPEVSAFELVFQETPRWQADVVLVAQYASTYLSEGWYQLEIAVNPNSAQDNTTKAWLAGAAEGYFQAQDIYNYWDNYRNNEFKANGGQPRAELLDWISEQHQYLNTNIESRKLTSEYWRLMEIVLAQFDGLCHGYWRSVTDPARNLTWSDLYLLNSVGDLYDLNVLFPPNASVPSASRQYTPGRGLYDPPNEQLECSALIKLLSPEITSSCSPGPRSTHKTAPRPIPPVHRRLKTINHNEYRHRQFTRNDLDNGPRVRAASPSLDFVAAHTTFRPYYAMLRTWKAYDFPWSASGPLLFASSPGLLYSKDDWYTTDTLVIMETTNGIYNQSLFDLIKPSCALMWQRVQLANFGARSGEEWTSLFAQQNSGTYNNQWMVLDAGALGRGERRGVLWLLEQVPGTTQHADVSDTLLSQGFWASYNVPFFPDIYNMSGYPWPSEYHNVPRARIFSRDQGAVCSLEDMQALIRSNAYLTDPFSSGLPCNAVAARCDLSPAPTAPNASAVHRRPWGAVDAKVVDAASLRRRAQRVVCGPTWGELPGLGLDPGHGLGRGDGLRPGLGLGLPPGPDQPLPVFSWTGAGDLADGVAHAGTVDRFEFPWREYSASLAPAGQWVQAS